MRRNRPTVARWQDAEGRADLEELRSLTEGVTARVRAEKAVEGGR